MPQLILLLSAIFIVPIRTICQQHELEDFLQEKAMEYAESNLDSALYFAKRLQVSENQCRALIGHYYEANVFYRKYDYVNCEKKLDFILDQIDSYPNPSSFNYTELLVGKSYLEAINLIRNNVYRRFFYLRINQNLYTEAFDYLEKRTSCVEQMQHEGTNYLRNVIALEFSRAALNRRVGNYNESLRILIDNKSRIDTIYVKETDPFFDHLQFEKAHILNDLARNYECLIPYCSHYLDSVDLYTNLTYEATKRLKNSRVRENERSHYIRKSQVYLLKNNPEEALKYVHKAARLYSQEENMAITHLLEAKCWSILNQPDSAIYYSKQFLACNTNGGLHKSDHINIHEILAKSYYSINQIDSAYVYSNKIIEEIQSESFNKDNTQERLNKQQIEGYVSLNHKIYNKSKNLQIQLVIIIFMSIVLVSSISYLAYRKRKNHLKRFDNLKEKYTDLLSESRPISEPSKKIDDLLLKRILEELNQIERSTIFLESNFSLVTLAKLLQTNTSYLSKIINEHKDKNFRKYLIELRINHLIVLLEKKPKLRKHSIEALGKSIGYSNASSFTRAFKNHMGISPSEYLKQIALL